MHRFSWILQVVLGVYFIAVGVLHFVVPPGLPELLAWMYELPTWTHYVTGVAEIAGGLGLILPSLTRIMPVLTPLAAVGLIIIMVAAAVYHLARGEAPNIVSNLVLAALLAVIVYVRGRAHPVPPR